MSALIALFCGMLFGLGLLVSDMANPAKVIHFLDVLGFWDPSLLLVMLAALLVLIAPMVWARKQARSLLQLPMQLPSKREIDADLIVGSLLFGIGWGLIGLCPGPAVVLLGLGNTDALYFVCAMLLGMAFRHRQTQVPVKTLARSPDPD